MKWPPILFFAIALLYSPCFGQVAERVDLPDIAGAYWSTVVADESPDARRLLTHLARTPALRDLVRKTRYQSRSAADPFFVEKLRPTIGDAPVFVLQTPDGGVIYRTNGPNIPATGQEMADQVARHVAKWREMGCPKVCNLCPRPRPPKPPAPPAPVKPIPDVIPDQVAPADAGFDAKWIAAAFAAFLGGAGLSYYRKR